MIAIALTLTVITVFGSFSVSAAKDTLDGYAEFKGTVGVISNCDEGDKNQNGNIDPVGVPSGTTSPEVEGSDTVPGKASQNVSFSTDHYLQGSSAIKIKIEKDQTQEAGLASGLYDAKTRFVIRQMSGITVEDPNTTYLSFYMYCASLEDLKEINWTHCRLEVSEVQDQTEYEFTFTQLQQYNKHGNFKAGWNKVQVPLITGNTKGMKITRFRMFFTSNGKKDVELYFDNITLEKGDPFKTVSSNVAGTASKITVPTGSSTASTGASSDDGTVSDTASGGTASVDVSSETATSADASEISSDDADDGDSSGFPVGVVVAIVAVAVVVIGVALYVFVFKKKKA